MIKLTEELEFQIKDLNENQHLHRMKTNHIEQIIENEFVLKFELDFDFVRLVYAALDCVYLDTYYEGIDYDLVSIKRLAANFAYENLNKQFHFDDELEDLINRLDEARDSFDTRLARINRNNLNLYVKEPEDRPYVEDLIDILRFALYSLFDEIIRIIKLKLIQYEFEDQLISGDDLND